MSRVGRVKITNNEERKPIINNRTLTAERTARNDELIVTKNPLIESRIWQHKLTCYYFLVAIHYL